MQQHYETSSVFVAVIGRPNVGKSSLTNRLVGEKVAIVTSKPQTTRTRITGVVTRGPLQYVLLDTPGVHKAHNKLGKRMDKTASDSIADVDVSMMLFEPYGALNEPEMVLVDALRSSGGPAIAVINKTDLIKDPADLEARKAELKALGVFDAIYTVSVRADDRCEELFDALSQYAVEGPHYFDDDAYTDMPEKELVAEVIREKALLFIPGATPFDYYTKEYEKGLQLYSNGVLIMDKCADLLPEHFRFVRGVVDSPDLSLNISRELLQHDRQLKVIAANLEKKIKSELGKLLKDDREGYEKFWKNFGRQIKYGVVSEYGAHKDLLQDLLLFYSSTEKKPVTLAEYVSRMKEEQKFIYYAAGESLEKIDKLPQTEGLRESGTEILYFTEEVDEFCAQILHTFQDKEFRSVLDQEIEEGAEKKAEEAAANVAPAPKPAAAKPAPTAPKPQPKKVARSKSVEPKPSRDEMTFAQRMVTSKEPTGENEIPGMAPAQKIIIILALIAFVIFMGYTILTSMGLL